MFCKSTFVCSRISFFSKKKLVCFFSDLNPNLKPKQVNLKAPKTTKLSRRTSPRHVGRELPWNGRTGVRKGITSTFFSPASPPKGSAYHTRHAGHFQSVGYKQTLIATPGNQPQRVRQEPCGAPRRCKTTSQQNLATLCALYTSKCDETVP